LSRKLGTTDRQRLEEYSTGIREIEQRVEREQAMTCTPGTRPAAPVNLAERTKLMMDLTVLAFQCDLTRVVTFMLEDAGSNFVHSFLGLSGSHHT
jgi:hypothetical protein